MIYAAAAVAALLAVAGALTQLATARSPPMVGRAGYRHGQVRSELLFVDDLAPVAERMNQDR